LNGGIVAGTLIDLHVAELLQIGKASELPIGELHFMKSADL